MTNKRVLIVDDSRDIGQMLKAALMTYDASLQVLLVPSAEEAGLEFAKGVDLLVTDIRLPGISGFELTSRFHKRQNDIKVIQISGVKDAELEVKSRESGADYFLRKPISVSVFLDAVEKCLGTQKAAAGEKKSSLIGPVSERTRLQLVSYLEIFCETLDASTAILVDDSGQVLCQYGEFPDPGIEAGLVPMVLTTIAAGTKASEAMGSLIPEQVFSFQGSFFDLIATPISNLFTLLVTLKKGRTTIRMAIAFDEITLARVDIRKILVETGILTQSAVAKGPEESAPTTVERVPFSLPISPLPAIADLPRVVEQLPEVTEAEEEDARGLLDILGSVSPSTRKEDADAFWAAAADEDQSIGVSNPDTISYDEARKLGLAPGKEM